MKLFSVADVAAKKEAQTVDGIRRLQTLNKELLQSYQNLNKIEADFDITIETQQAQWLKEQGAHMDIVAKLKGEVIHLEERKVQALIPLEETAKKLDDKDKELSLWESELKNTNEELDEKSELLQEQLSTVAERETHADKVARLQTIAQQGIDTQKAQITLQSSELGKVIDKAIQDDLARQNAISRRETVLQLRDKGLTAKEERTQATERDLVQREERLKDRYLMLERTEKEINDRSKTRQQPTANTIRHSPK